MANILVHIQTDLILMLVFNNISSFRHLSHLWREGKGRRSGLPGHGQSLPHQLLHLLLLRTCAARQSVLQRAWACLLRGGLHGECVRSESSLPALISAPLSLFLLLPLTVFGLSADRGEVCNLWSSHHGNGLSPSRSFPRSSAIPV